MSSSFIIDLIGVYRTGPEDCRNPVRTAREIQIPPGSDAVVRVILVDQLDQPVVLDLGGGDSLSLALGLRDEFPALQVTATQGPDANSYDCAIASSSDFRFARPRRLLYDVWATKGGSAQQVVAISYLRALGRLGGPR